MQLRSPNKPDSPAMPPFERSVAVLLILFSVLSTTTFAETENNTKAPGHTAHFHKNVLGALIGITHAGRRKNGPVLGLEYERRFNDSFGVGGIIEYTGGDADVWVAAIPFVYHTGHWKLYVAPGIEDGHHGTEKLLRLGGEYAFEFSGGWEVAPQLNVDFVDGEKVWVFGIVLAKGY